MINTYSNYYVSDSENKKILIVSDENPEGVTLIIRNNNEGGGMENINMPRKEAIEVLEYLLLKIKARN